ncbi:hypothetical protein AAFF_G00371030 [Aldrovandia affinis]|uniref:Uncharacterized protein n=1 Tax=Aldrovandia affinis TaxID=143900 RepID=A0AAD7WMJ1_9TELE|nr:hypothetical protein AAFF_G00371030 [Aldrovandia affinis]
MYRCSTDQIQLYALMQFAEALSSFKQRPDSVSSVKTCTKFPTWFAPSLSIPHQLPISRQASLSFIREEVAGTCLLSRGSGGQGRFDMGTPGGSSPLLRLSVTWTRLCILTS